MISGLLHFELKSRLKAKQKWTKRVLAPYHLKMIRKALLIFAGALISAYGPVQAQTASFGVRELLLEAQKSQIQWKQALTAVEQAKESVTIERSGFLPDLGLRSSVSRDWQSSSLNQESTGSRAEIVSQWSLYDNGTQFREYSRSRLELERAQTEEHRIREEVAYNLLSRYANYILLLRQREISLERIKIFENQFKMSQRQYRQGLKTRSDNLRLEAEVERVQLSLLRYEEQLKSSFEELVRYVGVENALKSAENLKIKKNRELFLGLLNSAIKNPSLEAAPAVQTSKLSVDIQKILTREQQSTIWPRVYLNGEGGYGSTNFIDSERTFNDNDRFFGTVQLQLNWTLFNWGGNTSQYQRALLSERLSEAQYSQTLLDVKTDNSRLTRQANLLQRSLQVQENLLSIETKTLKDIETEYREGRASYLDLSTSLNRRFQAELDLEQETLNSLINLAGQRQLLGNLYEACLNL